MKQNLIALVLGLALATVVYVAMTHQLPLVGR